MLNSAVTKIFLAMGALGALTPSPGQAQSPASQPSQAEEFRIGTSGALCEAQGVMLSDARGTIFDRKWAILCSDIDRPVDVLIVVR